MFDYPFKTGDLICMQCTPFISAFTPCVYEHVGMVLCDAQTSQLFLWHMNGEGFIWGKYNGINIQPLYKTLGNARQCAVRALQGYHSVSCSISNLMQTFENNKMNRDALWQTLKKLIPNFLCGHNSHNQIGYLSCFQLVIQTYDYMGIFIDPNILGLDLVMSKNLPFGPLIALDTR